ncbi:Superoxide dismutase [Mn] [Thermoflexales bacterium]|nr:Superoxide dismutase [Mn] [Thermoflexales bacterium]
MAFELPPLPYDYSALEPHIDTQTMQIHHDKHHAAYVTNLNKALESAPDAAGKSIDAILADLNAVPDNVRQAVINNGGGHYNHTLFWEIMGPKGGGEPKGDLAKAIEANFGNYEGLREKMNNAGLTRFGSGWAWLVLDKDGKLQVLSTANQDCPVSTGQKPLVGIDVWEHAYYLKYQNRRGDYLSAWWNVINWDAVAARYAKLK